MDEENMEKIVKLVEESALQLVSLDSTDLTALANLHTQVQKIMECAGGLEGISKEQAGRICTLSQETADLIEKIILRETQDIDVAIQSINQSVQSMQRLLQQGTAQPGQTKAQPPASPAPAAGQEKNTARDDVTLPENVDRAIFNEFIANYPFTLEGLENAVMAAEKQPSEENRIAVKAILHNLKGESGLMGLQEIAAVCHEAESLLENLKAPFPAEKLLHAKDWLQNALAKAAGVPQGKPAPVPESPQKTGEKTESPVTPPPAEIKTESLTIAEGDVPLVMDFINESREHLESAESNLLLIEENPSDNETLNAIFRAFHTIKGVAGFLNLHQIGSLAHAAENLLDLARKGELLLAGPSVDVIFESIDVTKTLLAGLAAAVEKNRPVESYSPLPQLIQRIKTCAAGETPAPKLGTILVEKGTLSTGEVRAALQQQKADQTGKKLGEILTEEEKVTPEQVESALRTQEMAAAVSGEGARNKKAASESTVKVTTERLDSLINMVGEMVIAQSMVSQDLAGYKDSNPRVERNIRHLEKITRELQDLSMSMRMVPVQGVFQKMARLVRDLSRKAGKEIELNISGAETELDRNVVEAIADPLVHMVRNSIDHGIESAEDRVQAGKKRVGRIDLKAFHQGGNIVIQIVDDGRGLNREKILQKAVKNGIVKEGQELSDEEVYKLIFHAGLSTAEKITDISGRGVGMDVVRKNVESLRGRVDIQSEPGRGSAFSISLPLTLAVIDGQIVSVGKEKFIIPTISLVQSIRPAPDQLSTVCNRGEMVMVRGKLIPMIRLGRLFGIQAQYDNPAEALIVIVADGSEQSCLLVDSLLGQQQVVIKNLGDYLGHIRGISGGAIMGDGNVHLILDVPGLIALANHRPSSAVGVA